MKRKFECSIPYSKEQFVDLVFEMTKQEDPFDRHRYDFKKSVTIIFSSFNPRNNEVLIYTSSKFRGPRSQPMGLYIKVKEEENGCKLIGRYKVLSIFVKARTIPILLFTAAIVFIPPTEDTIAVYAKVLLTVALLTFATLMNVIGTKLAFFVNGRENELIHERMAMILQKTKRDGEMP